MPKMMPASELLKLQQLLKHRGFSLGGSGPRSDGVDGEWGPMTAKALDGLIDELAPGLLHPAPPKAAPPPATGPNPLTLPAVPAKYQWLCRMGDNLPRTIWEGLHDYGVKEIAGAANSQIIMQWAAEVGLTATYTSDEVPWCGLWAAVIAKRSGKPVPKQPLWALNWMNFGVDPGQPGLGDVLVFVRDGGGHVGFYVGEDATHYHCLGGNTSNQVMIARIEKKRLKGARRPVYRNQPASVKPYLLDASGGVSTNEA